MTTIIPNRDRIELLPKNPYHTPGYGGYCPQFKYKIGDTFGRTTHQLLEDGTVASSNNFVLSSVEPVDQVHLQKQREREQILRNRTENWGGQMFGKPLVPGYTGFVPRLRQFYGERYTEKGKSAVAAFETDHLLHKQKMAELPDTTRKEVIPLKTIPNTNCPAVDMQTRRRHVQRLVPILNEAPTYVSPNAVQPSLDHSPYRKANDDPNKFFMSSYMGYVPKAKFHIGRGYPLNTHTALNEFTDAMVFNQAAKTAPVRLHRPERPNVDHNPLYPATSGLIPLYTGHIPGQKFRHGRTFGRSTYNAKDLATESAA